MVHGPRKWWMAYDLADPQPRPGLSPRLRHDFYGSGVEPELLAAVCRSELAALEAELLETLTAVRRVIKSLEADHYSFEEEWSPHALRGPD
jgi:hypothetical protein